MSVIGVVALVLVGIQRVPPLLLLALMVPFILFGMGFVTTNLLFRQDSDFAMHIAGGDNGGGALSAGLTLSLRALAIGTISILFALSVDPGAFVRALIAYLRFPARLGYALFVAMQLMPDLLAEAAQMRMARAMRAGRPMRRIPGPREMAALAVPLLAFAVRRAGRSAIAMEARGFGATPTRTMLFELGFIEAFDKGFERGLERFEGFGAGGGHGNHAGKAGDQIGRFGLFLGDRGDFISRGLDVFESIESRDAQVFEQSLLVFGQLKQMGEPDCGNIDRFGTSVGEEHFDEATTLAEGPAATEMAHLIVAAGPEAARSLSLDLVDSNAVAGAAEGLSEGRSERCGSDRGGGDGYDRGW
eukprot:jgi/Tetstr1/450840/TSEL_037876.t1